MSFNAPRITNEPSTAEKRSMTESETINFLRENNIQPLENWKPGQPLLYVLEETMRSSDEGPYRNVPLVNRQSIARLDAPQEIDFGRKMGEKDRVVYSLTNKGGQVDYYVIDTDTQKPRLVNTSFPGATNGTYFYVRKENLFAAADHLFPKSQQ